MTTIGTTSYYSSAARYAGAEQLNSAKSDSVYDDFFEKHESELDATTATSSGSDDPETTVDNGPSVATFKFMGQIITATNLAVDLKPINISELPEDQYQAFIEGEELGLAANKQYLENQYTDRSWTATVEDSLKVIPISPASQAYATIVVGGKVVATVFNDGSIQIDSNDLGTRLKGLLEDSANGTSGPDLAQARAGQIAEMLGGRMSKSTTALTQSQFDALPEIVIPQPVVDHEAMRNDPRYTALQKRYENLENLKQQREAFLAQQQTVVQG